MAAAATEYYGKLLCALIELQQLRAELLGQLSVQHAKGKSTDPNIALANILADQEAAVKKLKSMAYRCNETKIYDVSKNPPVLRNPIDVKVIDTTLQHDILLWLEGFPVSKPSNANRNNQVKCTGACAQLRKKMDICCNNCMQCNICNKQLPPLQQCPTYKLGLEKDKSLRNLVSHLTLKTLENFLKGTEGFPDFPHVNNWQDLSQEFVSTMTCISDYMGDANNFNNPNVKLLQQHEKTRKLDKLQTILNKDMKTECDLNLLVNLKQIIKEQHQKQIDEVEKVVADLKDTITKNYVEVTAKLDTLQDGQRNTHLKLDAVKDNQDTLQDGQRNTHLKLDALKGGQDDLLKLVKGHITGETSSDDQSTEEKSKERQNNWRNIAGGVVMRLDLTESETEVSDVCFSCKDDERYSVRITHKSSITKVGEPYYETHKVDECNMLLKIENMKNGNYIIEVTRTSSKSTFDVCVNYTFNNPANIIENKVGIGIPSSDNKQYWEQLTKTILDASMNEERIITFPLSKGASTKTQTLKEFEEIGAKYIERNFSQNFACIDPFNLLQKEYYKNIAECFEKLLKDKFVSRKRGVILVAPKIAYHSGLINASVQNECQNRDEHCLMVFLEEISLVLVARIASQAADISGEIIQLKNDIQHLVSIHRHRLNKESLTIAGIIACPSVEREQLKDVLPFQFADVHTELYETLFICKDDLGTETNQFTKWWDTSFSEMKKRLDIPNTRTESRFLRNMIGEHMVSMATVNESLPTLSCNPHDQMRTLILNPKQSLAINSLSTKKHIIGPFGSGKTLVGQTILKNLLKKLKEQDERSTLCYITCDEYSIVDCHVKKTIESFTNDKVKLVCGSLRQLYQEHVNSNLLSNTVSLDKLMKALTETYPKPHFVCDEVQSSVMTLDVAKSINEYLKTSKILQDAHVVFIQQSIKKDRKYQQHSLEADHFNLIEGLEVHRLQKVMRITMENQQLVDAAQRIIGKHKLDVEIPKRNRKEASRRVAMKTKNRVVEDVSQTATASSSRLPAENISTPTTEDMPQHVFEDFDSSLKVLSRSQSNKTKQNTLTTSIQFFDGKIGHKISSDRANLIYLPNTNDGDNIKVISLVLNNCCLQGTSPVFIASSLQSARMLNHGAKACNKETVVYIPYLQRRNPTENEKDEVLSITSNSSVLITDHKSFLGMEHEVVVTIADPTETIIRHSIVEIISRCTCNLFVFVLSQNKKSMVGSLGEILDAWVDDGLVDTMHVVLECGDEDSRAIKICESTADKNAKSKRTDVIVNTKSSLFVSLSEIIERFDDEEYRVHSEDEVYQTSKFLYSKIEEVAVIEDKTPSFRSFFNKFWPSKTEEVTVIEDEEQRIVPEITHDERTMTFAQLNDLLKYESTRDEFNEIITSEPSLTKLRNDGNETLLHKAAWYGATECVEVLIENGCDVKEKNDDGEMAIHDAANYNRTQMMKILLSHDPSMVNVTDNDNFTPLHLAAVCNHREAVELLLSQPSVDVNARGYGGRTPDECADERYGMTPDEHARVNDEIKTMIRSHHNSSTS